MLERIVVTHNFTPPPCYQCDSVVVENNRYAFAEGNWYRVYPHGDLPGKFAFDHVVDPDVNEELHQQLAAHTPKPATEGE